MSKQELISGDGLSHNDRWQREDALLVCSGFSAGPGSWARARTWARPRSRLGPGVLLSYFFFGVMGWGGRVDLFPWRCRFGVGSRSPSSGLSPGPVPVPEKVNSCNYLLITPLSYFQLTATLNEIVPFIFMAPASPSCIHPSTGPEINV